MIKYIEYDSFDDTGQHITPVNTLYQLNKTASGTYSPEIMKVILNMKRKEDRYYVVINAVGSFEAWGCNKNGDAFPMSGLAHESYRTDMSTLNDYGYKTFEYYAHLFKHHVNKDPKKSFGEVVFSHWNPAIQRVELVVAINTVTGADMIDALEKGLPVAVSMGCFTNPDYPILTKEGYRPIKDIKVGDLVMTHKGRWRKVTDLHRRVYTGKLHKFHVKGLPIPLELTSEHPVMTKSFNKDSMDKSRPYSKPEDFEKVEFSWSRADEIESGDHIKYTGTKYDDSNISEIGDESLARLMGYYTAEGSFIYNNGKPCTVQLSCNSEDDLLREVPYLVNKIYPNISCSILPHNASKNAFSVNINSTQLAVFMHKFLGSKSKDKFIPPEIFVSKENIKLAYLGAWLNGDGWCDKKGVHISSCNLNIVLQARDLFMSCGIPSSIYKITHKAGDGFSKNKTIEYTLNISHLDAKPLVDYCKSKLSNLEFIIEDRVKSGNSAIRQNDDGTMSYSIKSIETRYEEEIQTYNFSVEEDESYVAAGLTVHNCKVKYDRCSICDKKAKTRDEYCVHLRNYMRHIVSEEMARKWSRETGRIIKPGAQVFAWNDHPRFFDISKVNVGADRTAFILGKAANKGHVTLSADIAEAYGITDRDIDKLSQVVKKSEISKVIGGALGPTDIDGKVSKSSEAVAMKKALDEKIQKTILAEPRIPNHFLDAMAKMPIKNVISTMFGMGIMPKPAEFQRIIIVKAGGKEIADELERSNQVFDYKADVKPCTCSASNIHFSDALGKAMMPYLEKRSCFAPFLQKRLSDEMTKQAAYSSTQGNDYWLEENQDKSGIGGTAKILTGLAALYAGLKLKALGYGPKQLAEIFVNKPWLRTLLGGGVVWKIQDGINKSNANEAILRPASDYENILQNTNFSGHVKMSELADAVVLPNAYIHNAVNQESYAPASSSFFPGVGEREKIAGLGSYNKSILNESTMNDLNNRIIQLISI